MYVFDDGIMRVTEAELEELIDKVVDKTTAEITDKAALLFEDGVLTVVMWEEVVSVAIKYVYIQFALMASGGVNNVFDEVWEWVEEILHTQWGFLRGFVRDMFAGKLSLGRIKQRTAMYINSARQIFWRIRDWIMNLFRYKRERWHAVGDNATCGPCAHADDMGWQPLGTFAQPGSGRVLMVPATYCEGLTNCRCTKSYRR